MVKPQLTSTGWDPVLLISQIVSIQTLHYLTMALLIPPLLAIFAEPAALSYAGGSANVGMIMDWREMAGRPTARIPREHDGGWSAWNAVWSGGKQVHVGDGTTLSAAWDGRGRVDPIRGWIIAACWLAASITDIYYLYTLVRRPRLILDFSLTILFIHLVLTTYYSSAFPTSLFVLATILLSTALTVITAEQLCVKREMAEGLTVASAGGGDDDVEMGALLRRD